LVASAGRSLILGAGRRTMRQHAHVLYVTAKAEYKLKYAGSLLGYVWSVLKPLALFTMLYLVFGHVFKLGKISPYYAVALLIGIVCFSFFADATSLGMSSLVSRESLLRKLSFPRVIIPTSVTLTSVMTFAVNSVVVMAFVAWKGITPQANWVLIIPLVLELYMFTLGVALILSTLFVRFRDIGQIWELALQLLFYASPIIYPVGYLPPYLQKLAFLNPFAQVLQDLRAIILYPDLPQNRITAADAFGFPMAELIPISIAFLIFIGGLAFFKHEEPWFAERV
jgi:ABC-2 type transport system permease protein